MWRQKSKLERNLIIALIILLLLFIGLLLFVIIKPNVMRKKCASPHCLTAASQIMNRLDPTVDPCEDFFKFACGNYRVGAKLPILTIKENVDKQVMDIVNEPVTENDHYLLQTQKELYKICLNETLAEEQALEAVNRLVSEIGWPVVIGYQWREESFDWQELIFKLRRKGYPFQMMLNIGVKPHNSTFIVQVDPPRLKRITTSIDLYKKYMTGVAAFFGADVRRAEIEMERVFDFTENLYKVIEKNTDVNVITISEFQEENADIDWLHFLNNILYPVNQVSSDDEVEVPAQEFTTEYFNLIYRTPKRVIANYILWNVLEKLMPYMPNKLKTLKRNYACHVHESDTRTRSDFCTQFFQYFFPVPSNIMFVRKYLPNTKLKKVKKLVKNVKNHLKTILTKTPWLDDTSKSISLEKLDNVLDVIGAPYDYFDDSYLTEFVWPGQDNKTSKHDHFFNKLLDLRYMHQNNQFYKVHKKEKRNDMDFLYMLIKDVNLYYSPKCNSMILPAGILQDIFYDENRPMYLNYGALGSAIGHEFVHGFTEGGSHFDKFGYQEDIWTNLTYDAYAEEMKCMIREMDDFYANSSQVSPRNETIDENLSDYTGVKVAYSAYQAWVHENGEESMLVGVPYTPNQLFWISSISHQCFMPIEDGDRHADSIFRTIAPLRNTEDFAKDFNCRVNSPMNPSQKCQVF